MESTRILSNDITRSSVQAANPVIFVQEEHPDTYQKWLENDLLVDVFLLWLRTNYMEVFNDWLDTI